MGEVSRTDESLLGPHASSMHDDVPLERTLMSEVSFVGLSFQLLNGNYALCIISAKRMHNA